MNWIYDQEILAILDNGAEGYVKCHWAAIHAPLSGPNPTPESEYLWRTVDLTISRSSREPPPNHPLEQGFYTRSSTGDFDPVVLSTDPSVEDFLRRTVVTALQRDSTQVTVVKFVFPTAEGFVARADFLSQRLEGCVLVDQVDYSFLAPLQAVVQVPSPLGTPGTVNNTIEICVGAIGAIQLRCTSPAHANQALISLEDELQNRIAFPWLLRHPLPRKRLAFVEGRANIQTSLRMWETARALGIDVVILDRPGHWMQDATGPHTYLREAFIPIDMALNEGLAERIQQAVRGYTLPIHGLMTVSDGYLEAVAQAAVDLGYTTSPPGAYALAADKCRTRQMEDSATEAFTVCDQTDLSARLGATLAQPLKYPLIVKPSVGWNSECVTRVENETELLRAVRKASERNTSHGPGVVSQVLIEPYITGPEFDICMVLWDGEVLFAEISDGPPCLGDSGDPQFAHSFVETQMLYPSRLPEHEQTIVRESVHASLLRQGFRFGVFNCEGRVRDSSVEYVFNPGLNAFDLVPVGKETLQVEPSCYLLEVNARPPGYMASLATTLTYGVDYLALQMLYSLGMEEGDRFRAHSRPYRKGAQYDLVIQFVPPPLCTGVLLSDNPGREIAERCAELTSRDNIAYTYSVTRRGDVIRGLETNSPMWLGWYLATSRQGRPGVLRLGKMILDEYRYELDCGK